MARLPRYRRLGVDAARPAQLDFANLREQQRLAQTVSQQVDQMGDFVYRRASERAARQGVEAVEEQGARPILERIEAAGGPTTIPERAAFEAANRIAVAEIQMEADQQIAQLLQTAQQNMTPFSQVQTQLSDVVDGYAATLSTLDPQAAGLLRVRLQENTGRANTRYASWYQGRMRAAAAERRATAAEGYAANAMELARTAGVTPQAIYDQLQTDRQTLIDAGASESQADRFFNAAYGEALRENVLFTAATMSEEELAAVSLDPPTENLPGLSLTETFTEWRVRRTIINDRIAGYEAEATALNREVASYYDILGQGGTIGPEAEAEMLETAERLEAFSPGITTDVQNLISDRDYMQFAGRAPLPTLQAELDQVEAGLPGQGEAGIDTAREVARANLLRNVIEHNATVFSTGRALEYGAEQGVTYNGEVVGAPIDFSSPENLSASLSRRFSEVAFIEARNGVGGQNVLLPQEIAQLNQLFSEAPIGDRQAFLGMLADSLPPEQAQRVLGDLGMETPQIRFAVHAGALITEGSVEAVNLAFRGTEVERPAGLTASATNRIASEEFGAALSELPDTYRVVTEFADMIYRGMARDDASLVAAFDSAAYTEALRMALGNMQIADVGGSRTLLPVNIDVNAVERYFESPFPNTAMLANPDQPAEFAVIQDGDWHPLALPRQEGQDPQYILVSGAGQNQVTWTDANDQPVIVNLSALTMESVNAANLGVDPVEQEFGAGAEAPQPTELPETPQTPQGIDVQAEVQQIEQELSALERNPDSNAASDLFRRMRNMPRGSISSQLYERMRTVLEQLSPESGL